MKLKPGVSITGIKPELSFGLMVVKSVFEQAGYAEFVITSVCDGHHSTTSLHYAGCAADVRTRDMTLFEVETVVDMINLALPDDFDVINEGNHIHIEWQPRRK